MLSSFPAYGFGVRERRTKSCLARSFMKYGEMSPSDEEWAKKREEFGDDSGAADLVEELLEINSEGTSSGQTEGGDICRRHTISEGMTLREATRQNTIQNRSEHSPLDILAHANQDLKGRGATMPCTASKRIRFTDAPHPVIPTTHSVSEDLSNQSGGRKQSLTKMSHQGEGSR